NISVELEIEPNVPTKLDDTIEIQLLRVIMEALINVRKHACASKVKVTLKLDEAHLIITVVDDGKGFNTSDCNNLIDSYGLKTMQERMQIVKGWANVYSELGRGTTVRLMVPYENRGA
ncbi:MAG: ATP-binding protein, partial [Bacillota bacterium]|nr:ATP-binding protein [Bacillota bacterium]